MDTIIYLYHRRESTGFVTEKWQENGYCLIRLGVPSLLWKNLRELDVQDEKKVRRRIKFWGIKRHKSRTPEPRKQLSSLLNELGEIQAALTFLGDNPYRTYCVYEDFLREKIYTECFQKYWSIPEFEDYHEYIWVRELMPYTVPGDYIILGYADCLPDILWEFAGRMRSVKWFLRKEQYTPELEEFLENFYEEYGLAVEMHLVEEIWNRVRLVSVFPVNVLDFAREEKISACDLAAGSIWLDMDSLDGKNSRMEARTPDISYFSMKKQWKQRQKEAICLDTIGKNGYNTIVK